MRPSLTPRNLLVEWQRTLEAMTLVMTKMQVAWVDLLATTEWKIQLVSLKVPSSKPLPWISRRQLPLFTSHRTLSRVIYRTIGPETSVKDWVRLDNARLLELRVLKRYSLLVLITMVDQPVVLTKITVSHMVVRASLMSNERTIPHTVNELSNFKNLLK